MTLELDGAVLASALAIVVALASVAALVRLVERRRISRERGHPVRSWPP